MRTTTTCWRLRRKELLNLLSLEPVSGGSSQAASESTVYSITISVSSYRYRRPAVGGDGATTASRTDEGVLEGQGGGVPTYLVPCLTKYFLQFIEGMLTNLGSLPLDRIQMMLKIAPDYDRTIDQLAMFMEAARREGLVTVHGGMWKLNR